jgi:hypothetical protein
MMTKRDQRARAAAGLEPKSPGEPIEVERILEVNLPAATAFNRALEGIHLLRKSRVSVAEQETGRIDARIGTTWKSFGERVSVEVLPTGATTSRVLIRSKPRLSITIVDYGKNDQNVGVVAGHFG